MTRQNRSPSGGSTIVNTLRPYEGGTGQTTAIAALVAMDVVPLSAVNQANGVAGLDNSGKLSASSLPIDKMSVVSIEGPAGIAVSTITTYKINNFDMFSTYDIQPIAGASISRNGDTITFTAPNVIGASGFTINGRQITVNIVEVRPNTPLLTAVDVAGSTSSFAAVQCAGSAFTMNAGSATQASADWQVASDNAFNTIVNQSMADVTNKTTWKSGDLSLTTTYYARVRYRDVNNGLSDWSNVVAFTTKSQYVIGTEEAKFTPAETVSGDQTGFSVAIDSTGDRVAVGSSVAGGTGAVYIFLRNGVAWNQEAKLVASDAQANSLFGSALAMSIGGDRLAVGCVYASTPTITTSGAVYVYTRSGTTWTQEAKIFPTDPEQSARFGNSLSFTADTARLAIGCHLKNNGANTSAGAMYIFQRTGTSWAQGSKTAFATAGGQFGASVSFSSDGTRLAVYVPGATSTNAGVRIYTVSGINATFERAFTTYVAQGGVNYGYQCVSMNSDGTRLVVADPFEVYGSTGATGAVYIYLRTGTSWAQEARIPSSVPRAQGRFGVSVVISADGSNLIIGAPAELNGAGTVTGVVYTFNRVGTTWTQKSRVEASDPVASMQYGFSCGMSPDGTRVVVGAPGASRGAVTNTGAAYVYR